MSTENIVSKKFRILTDAVNKVYDRCSFWTKASDIEFSNGNNAQTTLSSITGISDSLTSTSSNVGASAASVKALNDKITELSSNLGVTFTYGAWSQRIPQRKRCVPSYPLRVPAPRIPYFYGLPFQRSHSAYESSSSSFPPSKRL